MSPLLQRGVTLGPGATFPLRVALAGTGAIEGVVEDARGRALAGVRVRVEARGDGLPGALALEARSDFEGRYRIEGVEIGRAELVARQDGVELGVSRAVLVAPHATSRADFAVPDAGFLVGRVSQDGRAAPVGTAVVAVPMKAGPGAPQIARAVADAAGSYSLALPAGEYRIHAAPGDAERTDLRVAPAFARVAAGKTSRLDVAAVAASAEEGLEVLVLEPGGAPSPGAVVTLARAGDDRIALATSAGEDGRVVLAKEMGLAGAPVTMRARSGGRSGVFTGALPASGVIAVRLERGRRDRRGRARERRRAQEFRRRGRVAAGRERLAHDRRAPVRGRALRARRSADGSGAAHGPRGRRPARRRRALPRPWRDARARDRAPAGGEAVRKGFQASGFGPREKLTDSSLSLAPEV